MQIEVIDPDDTDGPINVTGEVWSDEKPHELMSSWSDEPCWCDPRIEGKYVYHRSVFDSIEPSTGVIPNVD